MKFRELKSLRDAAFPMTIVSWVLGIGTIEYPAGRPRRVLSVCWSLIWFIFLSTCFRIISHTDVKGAADIGRTLFNLYLIAVIICCTTAIYCGQVRSKDLAEFKGQLDRAVEILSNLGIPQDYGSLFKYQIIHLICIFFFMSITLLYRCFPGCRAATSLSHLITEQYFCIIVCLGDFAFSSYVRYIENRFRHLNAYLSELLIEEKNVKQSLQDLPSGRYNPQPLQLVKGIRIMHTLRNARDIHRQLCSSAKKLNDSSGVQTPFYMGLTLAIVAAFLFGIWSYSTRLITFSTCIGIKLACDIITISAQLFRTGSVVSACSMASIEAKRTGDLIFEFLDYTSSTEIREEIDVFSMQLMQDPLEFTACGLFNINHRIIRAMIGTISMYLVLMIQIPNTYTAVPSLTRDPATLFANTTI